MTLEEYIQTHNGKGIDTDGAYGNQCMDNMHKYCVDVLGLDLQTLAAPAARLVYQNFSNVVGHEKFTQIGNTPSGVPQKGDIVFFGASSTNPNGHVCIYIDGNINTFRSFDQNWPTEGYVDKNGNFIGTGKCHIQDHGYAGVLGWLRFKQGVVMVEITSDLYMELVTKASNLDKITKKLGFNPLDAISGDKINLYIDALVKMAEDAEGHSRALDGQIKAVTADDMQDKSTIESLTKQLEEKGKRVEDLQVRLDSDSITIEKELSDIEELKQQIKICKVTNDQSMSILKTITEFISKFIKFT